MAASPDFLDPRPDLAEQAPPVRVDDKFDDMLDRDVEVAAYRELPLAACRAIEAGFRSFDARALWHQKWHKRITRIAALTGTLAVIMAILGLALNRKDFERVLKWVSGSEIIFAVSALAVAAIGLSIAFKSRWLFYRHQAELCRLLKFRFLLQPGRWRKPDAALAWIEVALEQIRGLDRKKSVEHAIETAFPRFSSRAEDAILARATVVQLCNYYRSKRLGLQRAYLENRAGQNAGKMVLYSKLPTALFFLSVMAAVVHFGLEYWHKESGILFAGLAAACLPVAATWARTIRAAFEHSRNKSRFRAASAALADLERCLQEDLVTALPPVATAASPQVVITMREERVAKTTAASGSDPAVERVSLQRDLLVQSVETSESLSSLVNAGVPLQDMLWCEQILHTEHIEWLRLMVETEWYG